MVTSTPFRADILSLDPFALKGSRCPDCRRLAFPPREVCPNCRSQSTQTSILLGTRGIVYSFTIVHQAPPGIPVPYVLAYVDLEDEVRVMAQLDLDDLNSARIGMEVDLSAYPLSGGDASVLGYRFRSASNGTKEGAA